MKRILGLSIAMYVAATGTGCEQPGADCTTGHGGFAAKYTLKPGTKMGMGNCDTLLGEVIGLEKYNPAQKDDDNKQDLTQATLAIRSTTLGDLKAAADAAGMSDTAHSVNSVGAFESVRPDESNVCHVPAMSPAQQVVPMIDMNPARDVTYQWSDVRVYVTPAYPGTRMAATLMYTENGCSAEYDVLALWPAVSCEVTDALGNGTGQPDITLCDPKSDPANGRPYGSGINPDFKSNVACDPDLLLCVLNTVPEELR
jgi:hypothetical protein